MDTGRLSYHTQKILLSHISFSQREDLRQVGGMKGMDDRTPFFIKKMEIGKRGETMEVEMHGEESDPIRYWEFRPAPRGTPDAPGELYTKWESAAGRILSEKTSSLIGSVSDGLNNLLKHLLDREGTVIKKLKLRELPSSLHFAHSIRVHTLILNTKKTDFSMLATIQLPMNDVEISEFTIEQTECTALTSAKNIKITDNSVWEHLDIFEATQSLSVRSFRLKVWEMATHVKNLCRKPRPSGFRIAIETVELQKLMNEIFADKELNCKEENFGQVHCDSFIKNGQKMFIYGRLIPLSVNIEFFDWDFEKNVPLSVPASNSILERSQEPKEVVSSEAPKAQSAVLKMPERTIERMVINCEGGKVAGVTVTGDNSLAAVFGCAPSKTIVKNVEIQGYCSKNPLDEDVVFAKNVKLVSEEPYPEPFFNMFATSEKIDSLVVTCKDTLRNGHKLVQNVRDSDVTYLDGVEKDEEEDTAEPARKKLKMSSKKAKSRKI